MGASGNGISGRLREWLRIMRLQWPARPAHLTADNSGLSVSPGTAIRVRLMPMESEWQLQEAKARFNEVFRLAREQGPQCVSKHGKTAVVVIPAEQYDQLRRPRKRKQSLTTFFAQSPVAAYGLEIDRPTDPRRYIDP